MTAIRALIGLFFVIALGLSLPASAAEPTHPEARLYDPVRDASADVDAALFQALRENKRVILVMGGELVP